MPPNSRKSSQKNLNSNESVFPHYYKDVRHLEFVDVYRVLSLYEVTDPAIAHAIKKLLVSGGRGAKDQETDIAEAIASLKRWQAMQEENASAS